LLVKVLIDTPLTSQRFGPTAHGAEGWTAFIPEMNKVTFIFKGNYNLEKNLPHDTASLAPFGLENECGPDCRGNAFALAGCEYISNRIFTISS